MTSPERISEQSMEEQLLEARVRIAELEVSSKTSISSGQFLCIVMVGPLFISFCSLGILIVYKTVSNPAEVSPYLQPMLLAMSIFSVPVVSAAGIIVSLMSDEIKAKVRISGGKFNEE